MATSGDIEFAVQALLDGKKLLLAIGDKAEPYDREGEQWVKVTSLFEGRPPTHNIMRLGTFAGLFRDHRFAINHENDD